MARPDAVDKANPQRNVNTSDAPTCHMCRLLSQHTDKKKCPRCGSGISSNQE